MNKALACLIGAGILAGIAGTGWKFFQSSMACHPLARACWQAVGEATGEAEAIALAEASFANNPREGARILVAFLKPLSAARAEKRLAVFALKQDPAGAEAHVGANPFEDPGLVADRVVITGEGLAGVLDVPLKEAIRPAPTPAGMHRPEGEIAGYRDGRPYGPESRSTWSLASRFFRWDDQKPGEPARPRFDPEEARRKAEAQKQEKARADAADAAGKADREDKAAREAEAAREAGSQAPAPAGAETPATRPQGAAQ
ncbi:MAG: hypothetical protein K6E40_13630 [Desulfovibrio sp.]|nr:hypothetical protein [Desulfovibrio sp.]